MALLRVSLIIGVGPPAVDLELTDGERRTFRAGQTPPVVPHVVLAHGADIDPGVAWTPAARLMAKACAEPCPSALTAVGRWARTAEVSLGQPF